MRTILTILTVFLCHLASAAEPQDTLLFEKYLEESNKLMEEFSPMYKRLNDEAFTEIEVLGRNGEYYTSRCIDYARWEQEYYQPLFKKSKEAMKRVTGTEDYLALWESGVPQKIGAGLKEYVKENEHYRGLTYSLTTSLTLFEIYTFAITYDNRAAILKDTEYEDTEKGEARRKAQGKGEVWIREGLLFAWEDEKNREDLKKLNVFYVFPPRFPVCRTTFDASWHIMAIYSFQNDRAKDILFDLATSSDANKGSLTDWAVYYLSLFPNSDNLLPKAKAAFQKQIAEVQKEYPDQAKHFIDENGNFINLLHRNPEEYRPKLDLFKFADWVRRTPPVRKLFRIAELVNALEYNEKIPAKERKCFNIFRRELAISWALECKTARPAPRVSAMLKKGDEHFEIYAMEYPMPGYGVRHFLWSALVEGDGDPYPCTLENPYWQSRKEFYERELANPRPIYTENQMEYIRGQLKSSRFQEKK